MAFPDYKEDNTPDGWKNSDTDFKGIVHKPCQSFFRFGREIDTTEMFWYCPKCMVKVWENEADFIRLYNNLR